MLSHLHSSIVLYILSSLSPIYAQCPVPGSQTQEQLCETFCVVSAQCNNQCSIKPSDQFTSCICQDSCICSMAICQSCCIAAGGQSNNPFCQSDASVNLGFCAAPYVGAIHHLDREGIDTKNDRKQVCNQIRTAWSTNRWHIRRLLSFHRLSNPYSTAFRIPQDLSSQPALTRFLEIPLQHQLWARP